MFVHGYAASGALYFRIWKYLVDHFVMLSIDLIGMGQSSRPDNFDKASFSPE